MHRYVCVKIFDGVDQVFQEFEVFEDRDELFMIDTVECAVYVVAHHCQSYCMFVVLHVVWHPILGSGGVYHQRVD